MWRFEDYNSIRVVTLHQNNNILTTQNNNILITLILFLTSKLEYTSNETAL